MITTNKDKALGETLLGTRQKHRFFFSITNKTNRDKEKWFCWFNNGLLGIDFPTTVQELYFCKCKSSLEHSLQATQREPNLQFSYAQVPTFVKASKLLWLFLIGTQSSSLYMVSIANRQDTRDSQYFISIQMKSGKRVPCFCNVLIKIEWFPSLVKISSWSDIRPWQILKPRRCRFLNGSENGFNY